MGVNKTPLLDLVERGGHWHIEVTDHASVTTARVFLQRNLAKGIEGIDESSPPAGLSRGLLAVREEPYQTEPNLKVGPGLYINGANDYHMLYKGQFMAVALDSDRRLAGHI